jgi:hypothetical protein
VNKIFKFLQREKQAFINPALFLVLLSIIISSEFIGFYLLGNEGFGFNIFLYYPFDFCFVIVSFLIFILGSLKTYSTKNSSKYIGKLKVLGLSLLWSVFWFIVTFVILSSVHFSLGGKL